MKNQLVIFFDGQVLVVLDCGDAVQDTTKILEWYAEMFDFELAKLTCAWSAVVDVRQRLKDELGL